MTALHPFDASISIDTLIPHRPPMQLIDRVLALGPKRLIARTRITRDKPFCTAAGVPACIGLEYLGQSAAAFFSTRVLFDNNQADARPTAPPPGMLIGSRSYACRQGYFPLASTLLIDISPTSAVTGSGLVKFRGAIHSLQEQNNDLPQLAEFLSAAQPFAEGDLSVYLPASNHASAEPPPDNHQ